MDTFKLCVLSYFSRKLILFRCIMDESPTENKVINNYEGDDFHIWATRLYTSYKNQ